MNRRLVPGNKGAEVIVMRKGGFVLAIIVERRGNDACL
jgi:hypothetical protein